MKLQRIEAILATAITIFALITIYSHNLEHVHNLAYPVLIYISFMMISQWIVPHFFRKSRKETGLVIILGVFFFLWLSLAGVLFFIEPAIDYWSLMTEGESLGVAALVIFLCVLYEILKHVIVSMLQISDPLKTRIVREVLWMLGGGAIVFVLLNNVSTDTAIFWLTAAPYTYTLYALNTYWLMPYYEKKQESHSSYLLVAIIISFLVFIPFGALFLAMGGYQGLVFFVMWFGLLIIVLPISYYLFYQQKGRTAQLLLLRKELGQTSAGLNFLRSQINPHFLFNALNTLYGTAMQEHADRTATGIQKLGDMMRFMLHENNQDQILLNREIDYLTNYIELQELRTVISPHIIVETDIQESLDPVFIAPMLLIPFVENAFKHGISLEEKSWISISLKTKDGMLDFDVHNSIHRKSEKDPEYQHSGVGLDNVRHRLAALYGKKHELIVRETSTEYFVHLTIKLS